MRDDLLSLLREFENLDVVDNIVESVGNKRRRFEEPEPTVVADSANLVYRAALPKWDEQQQQQFEKYYGAHPSNCEGARFFGNSEAQECFAKVTGSSHDVTIN